MFFDVVHSLLYGRTTHGSNVFGTMEIVRDIGSLSLWELIMVPIQEANGDNLGKSFRSSMQ